MRFKLYIYTKSEFIFTFLLKMKKQGVIINTKVREA